MPHGSNKIYTESFPNCTNVGEERFIAEIGDGTIIGYKYFEFKGEIKFSVLARSQSGGKFEVSDKLGGALKAVVEISPTESWKEFSVPLDVGEGFSPVFYAHLRAHET